MAGKNSVMLLFPVFVHKQNCHVMNDDLTSVVTYCHCAAKLGG